MEDKRPRIIDVLRKPMRCPVCGERVVDIIYGTGDMTEIEFLLEYRREGMMGGNNIPRRPPIWECSCGCKRFRKVNHDGTDAPVKVKLLKNLRKRPLADISFTTAKVQEVIAAGLFERIHHYKVEFITEQGEKETMSIDAISEWDAEDEVRNYLHDLDLGLQGVECVSLEVREI